MKKNSGKLINIICFIVPVVISTLAFANVGIFPGGPNTILIYDMRGEFVAYYGYLSHGGPGYDTLFHSMGGGLGGNFFGTFAMYLSLFDLVYSFVPLKYIPDAVYYMLLFKIGLSGLFMSLYLTRFPQKRIPGFINLILSVSYALMSYVFAYCQLPMFFDSIIFLPILALFSERIISGKKSILFIICLSLCIISNYYTAYMNSVCIFLYFVFRLSEERGGFKDGLKKILSLFTHGLLSAGISSFLILPVLYDLSKGKLSSSYDTSLMPFFKNTLFEILKMFLPDSYSGLGGDQPPYIYCGSIVIIFAVLFFVLSKKNISGRITGLLIISFYFLSFSVGTIDRLWHGGRDPIGFSARYSYTFVFFMIVFAASGYETSSFLLSGLSTQIRKIIKCLIILFVFAESYTNASSIIFKLEEEYTFVNRNEYLRNCDVMNNILDWKELNDTGSYSRLVKNYNFSMYDGLLFGYDGLAMFSSNYNETLVDMFRNIGLNANNNFIKENGLTGPVAGYMGVGYFLSYMKDLSDVYDPLYTYKTYTLYKNNYVFPFGFYIKDDAVTDGTGFGNDPFENINILFRELDANENNINIYIKQDIDDVQEFESSDGPYNVVSFAFDPQKSGDYMFYRRFLYSEELSGSLNYMPSDISYYKIYADGLYRGDYGFLFNRYCADLGYIGSDKKCEVSFQADDKTEEEIYLYYFDEDSYCEIFDNVEGFDVSEINDKGIFLTGNANSEKKLVLTLPYDRGYNIYVDGKKTGYSSYRDALILLSVPEGTSSIEIRFVPRGLTTGLTLSLIFIMLSILFYKLDALNRLKIINN